MYLLGTGTSYTASKKENSKVHSGATALTWLTNPNHAKYGTKHSRYVAASRAKRLLFRGLREHGFYNGAICIHGYEAGWSGTDNATHNTYFGGMQMDREFQLDYGKTFYERWGTADNWPIWSQLYASYKAWLSRWWYPWPKTARFCGLL